MIEIRTILERSVYFVEETVKCRIDFTNVSQNEQNEKLALSCAQINCHLEFHDSGNNNNDNNNNNNNQPTNHHANPLTRNISTSKLTLGSQMIATSFDQSTDKLVATEPRILFCDLTLGPSETKSFYYEEIIPSNSPPSYRGQNIKYIYSLCIGTQRINSSMESIRLPLQILRPSISKPTNKHQPMPTYAIATKRGRLGRFSLVKPYYKLGENIIGMFDFSDAKLHCVMYTVSLQSVEKILVAGQQQELFSELNNKYQTSHSELCVNIEQTQLLINVPLTIAPAFETDKVSLEWRLHFEFGIASTENLREIAQRNRYGYLEVLQGDINIETVVWDLPITIYPSHPIQISKHMNACPFVAQYNM